MATMDRQRREALYGGPLDGYTVIVGGATEYVAPIALLQSLSDADNHYAMLHPVRYVRHPMSGRLEFESSGAPTKPTKRK